MEHTILQGERSMTPTQRLLVQLKFSRTFCDLLLADFKTPEQWTHQVYPGTNHALWFIGHIANSDNAILGTMVPDKKVPRPAFAEKFRAGSTPTNNPADYPPPEEVQAFLRERREALLAEVAKLTDADLAKPIPPTARWPRLPDIGGLVAFIRLSRRNARRPGDTHPPASLGFKPVVDIPQNRPTN